MKKTVLIFGSIAGAIVTLNIIVMAILYTTTNKEYGCGTSGMILGFSSMIIAFSFIFIGIKNYRDKFNNGVISFAKAWKIGAIIAFISSSMYVITWLIVYYNFMPDFMDIYTSKLIANAKLQGLPPAKLNEVIASALADKEAYKKPMYVVWITYCEVLPLGLIFATLGALFMKRKSKDK